MDFQKIVPLLIKKANEPLLPAQITPDNGFHLMAIKFAHHQLRKRQILEALKLYRKMK